MTTVPVGTSATALRTSAVDADVGNKARFGSQRASYSDI
jgi:hypothetical protein